MSASSFTRNSGIPSSVASAKAVMVLPVPGGPIKQELAAGCEAVSPYLRNLSVLLDDAHEPLP